MAATPKPVRKMIKDTKLTMKKGIKGLSVSKKLPEQTAESMKAAYKRKNK